MSSTAAKTAAVGEVARLTLDDQELELPIVEGTEQECGLDISKLRAATGVITLDEGYVNTGSTKSAVTFLNGEEGILRYRGYPIEDLAQQCDFVEVGYLLIYGELPTTEQLEEFRSKLRRHTMLHEDMRFVLRRLSARRPSDGHPELGRRCVVDLLSRFA